MTTVAQRKLDPYIMNWNVLDDVADPVELARAALKGTMLAHLVAEALALGGDTLGLVEDLVAEELARDIARFNSHLCHTLLYRLEAAASKLTASA